MYIYWEPKLKIYFTRLFSGVPEAYKIISQRYECPVLMSEAGYKGNNDKTGYSVQGLVAKVKDTVANG